MKKTVAFVERGTEFIKFAPRSSTLSCCLCHKRIHLDDHAFKPVKTGGFTTSTRICSICGDLLVEEHMSRGVP